MDCFLKCTEDPIDDDLAIAGVLVFAGGAIYDLATAGTAADDYNRAHERTMTVMPTALRGARGETAPGPALVGHF
jgi:hypothetical protein